ncbi:MAG: hypothetical protein ACTIDN_07395, partial [Acetobacter sp.]|uniref:hypothetical protein n=1 Tax=Acetobacter sp. TaxID=440 RepID=UPI003F9132E0
QQLQQLQQLQHSKTRTQPQFELCQQKRALLVGALFYLKSTYQWPTSFKENFLKMERVANAPMLWCRLNT